MLATLTVSLESVMIEIQQQKVKPQLPFKSVAVALLFSTILGPVGLLYSSVLGGVVMTIITFIVISVKFSVPIILTWIGCNIWSVAATNRYNNKLMNSLLT